ncbi:MAG TPA: prepilin-type N-terminal cleavage/methylation domain-containing protein [Vicinamibacterales bacterium]|jgi:prepilin-type N-terminal cleavage/methylation domain-containing protein|nr:prepilin-type N-terminal cleavage/methylation domain-containing protein [Vicinamibacterales bacterium]
MNGHTAFDRLRSRQGMTLIELCIVIVILGILLVVAVASLQRARMMANESSAIAILQTINKAQFAYASECGRGHYAASLTQLGGTRPGRDQSYLAEDIGIANFPQRNGYTFNVRGGAASIPGLSDCNNAATRTTYYASAVPSALSRTGSRSFATSQANGIWQTQGGVPPTEPLGPPSEYVR